MPIDEKAFEAFMTAYWCHGPSGLGFRKCLDAYEAAKASEQPVELPERDKTKPAEEQGVFRKFDVRRTDGSDQSGGKHHGCEYFVLDTDHDPHAKAALSAYAMSCVKTHPELSKDMFKRYELHPLDIEALEQQYYKRGWKEAQEHYTKRESGGYHTIPVHAFLPEEGKAVIVAGGLAKYRRGVWYSGMEEPPFSRPIEWEVEWWMPIPLNPTGIEVESSK